MLVCTIHHCMDIDITIVSSVVDAASSATSGVNGGGGSVTPRPRVRFAQTISTVFSPRSPLRQSARIKRRRLNEANADDGEGGGRRQGGRGRRTNRFPPRVAPPWLLGPPFFDTVTTKRPTRTPSHQALNLPSTAIVTMIRPSPPSARFGTTLHFRR